MPLTFLRHATQKPPLGPLWIDPGNPLGKGLVAATLLNDYGSLTPWDYGRYLAGSLTGTSWVSTARGPGISVTVSGDHITWPAGIFTLAVPANVTVALRFMPTAVTSYMCIMDDGSGSSAHRNLGIFLDSSGGATTIYVMNAQGQLDGIPVSTITAGTWYDLVVVVDQGTAGAGLIDVYQNGLHPAVAQAFTWFSAYQNNTTVFGSNPSGGGSVYQGQYAHMMLWNRTLSAPEAFEVMAEPYAIFQSRPMRRWLRIATSVNPPPGLGPVAQMQEPFHLDTAMMR